MEPEHKVNNTLNNNKKNDIGQEKQLSPMEKLDLRIKEVKQAQEIYSHFSQEQVDKIFKEAALFLAAQRIPLAKLAVEETGMGIVEDKVIKNHFASEYVYNAYKNVRTCGQLEEDHAWGYVKVAEPIGIIAAIIPTTNPTSTAIFKALIALKTRNGIVVSPHPRAKKCTKLACDLINQAAVKAGAPEGLIYCIEEPSVELTNHLMQHPDTNIILATGGPAMVKSAYSSGKPALGVGAGNTPVIIDSSADIEMAVNSILLSKTFDNGVICASEQSVTVVADVYDAVIKEFQKRGAYLVDNEKDRNTLSSVIMKPGKNGGCNILNADIVGQSAHKIAQMAGLTRVEKAAKILLVKSDKFDPKDNFAHEKLSPVLTLYKVNSYNEALDNANKLVLLGGAGHTSVLYANETTAKAKIVAFNELMPTARILINTPASQGAIGDIYNFHLAPSLTLGCGSWGGNSVSENVTVKHLINVKTIAKRRENMLWFQVPPKIYFKPGCLPLALEELSGHKKALIISDGVMEKFGYVKQVTDVMQKLNISTRLFTNILPDPDIACVREGVEVAKSFEPDVIIALGGGSVMDAAKIIWLLYENPDEKFEDLALRFMDIRKRIYQYPKLGKKAQFVAVPTTSGTGSEVTPFSVITDGNVKYPLADYAITPDMAIIDPNLVMEMPKSLVAFGGLDAIVHCLEAYVSIFATPFTNGLAIEALELLFKYLPISYASGNQNLEAKENVHYAATMAGMAFANAFLGICHSLAHKIGGEFHVPHGLTNAMLIEEVIKYNATECPTKQGILPQYKQPQALQRYGKVAVMLGFANAKDSDEVKLEALIKKINEVKTALNVPNSFAEYGLKEADFLNRIDIMSENAFDDQCTGANPRYPLIGELKEIYLKCFYGKNK